MPDSRVQKWQRWLEDSIRNEVLSLHWHRLIYREVGEIVEANPDLPPSTFFTFVGQTYLATQAVTVRRQAETKPQVISLGRLMKEMASDSGRLTRRLYVSMYDEHIRDLADPDFDRLAGAGADHVPASRIEADLTALRQVTRTISDWVDRHVAHVDQTPLQSFPTFNDLNVAIDAIGAAFNKCSGILKASSWATLEPVAQHNWLAVFHVPWVSEGQHRAPGAPRFLDQQ